MEKLHSKRHELIVCRIVGNLTVLNVRQRDFTQIIDTILILVQFVHNDLHRLEISRVFSTCWADLSRKECD